MIMEKNTKKLKNKIKKDNHYFIQLFIFIFVVSTLKIYSLGKFQV